MKLDFFRQNHKKSKIMESNAVDLLKDAVPPLSWPFLKILYQVFEENVDTRLLKISKACKKITELLPFEKKCLILGDQPELVKYLLLCLPLFGKSVNFF